MHWRWFFPPSFRPQKQLGPPQWQAEGSNPEKSALDVERRTAAASRLHLGVLELEARRFQGLHVIHRAAVQVHQRRGVDKHLQVVKAEHLVHHPGLVLKRHRILETRAAAAYHANAKAGRKRI